MRGSEFAAYYGPKGLPAWEAAAVACAQAGNVVAWPQVPLQLSAKGHTATLLITGDVFAVGDADDFLRLPLLPATAQTIANLTGSLLPTPKLVYEAYKQATARLEIITVPELPEPFNRVNMGPSMGQYAAHNAKVEERRVGRTGLLSGLKKDVVVGALMKPGKVVIYGWFHPERPYFEVMPVGQNERKAQPHQPRSNVHGADYVDYSHGIHFVSPTMMVDGQPMLTVEVYQHPELSALVSDEGPVRTPRYPASNSPAPVTFPALVPSHPSLSQYGAGEVLEWHGRSFQKG